MSFPCPRIEEKSRMETPSWKAVLVAALVSSSITTGLFYLFLLRVNL